MRRLGVNRFGQTWPQSAQQFAAQVIALIAERSGFANLPSTLA
ncbi:hypothetical protein RR11_3517 [Ruegeria sp. R11]|nr:hypothetical protein RR11_3517 [Ruegeria sp. R11]